MQRSDSRILTTHTGSLPRPDDVVAMLDARSRGEAVDEAAFEARVRECTFEAVRRQVEAGIDVVNDGEMSKISYLGYVAERLAGFGLVPSGGAGMAAGADLRDFPDYAESFLGNAGAAALDSMRPACTGPLAYANRGPLERDLRNAREAASEVGAGEVFLTAASPGVLSISLENREYDSREAYLRALGKAMREEYEAIVAAGFLLQIDCPDLALSRHMTFARKTLSEYRDIIELHVDVLNEAVAGIPPESMRMHLCWGNYPGPHHRDVPLANILDVVLRARPAGLVLESCNPRHAHEWELFRELELPDGALVIPGVIESSSSYIEHPEVVAQRIERFAAVVGRENVVAGTDCGFATVAGYTPVHRDLAWAKLEALVEGARLASERLWP